MIARADVIKVINDYQNRVNLVAFPMNLQIDLKTNQEAQEFLVEMTKMSDGAEIQLSDYSQLQQYMQAVNILNNTIDLPNYGTEEEDRELIKKWQKSKFHLPPSSPPVIVLASDIFALYKKWQENERYLVIPAEFEQEAYASVMPYLRKFKSLSPEKQAEVVEQKRHLEMIKSPKLLFERAKVIASNGLIALVELIKTTHKDKGSLIEHVFLDFQHDFGQNQLYMAKAFNSIQYWLQYGIDDKYRITPPVVADIVKNANATMAQTNKAKKEAEKKQESAEQAKAKENLKKADELAKEVNENDPEVIAKEKARAQFREEYRQIMIGNDDARKNFDIFKAINGEVDTLKVEPTLAELQNQEALASHAEASNNEVSNNILNLMRNLSNS